MAEIDREKVINGLSCHVYGHPHTRCHKCPYWGTGAHGSSECTALMADALALLKEQEVRELTIDEWREWKANPNEIQYVNYGKMILLQCGFLIQMMSMNPHC